MKPNPFAFTSIRPVGHLVVTLLGLMCVSASATIYYWDATAGLNNGIGGTGSLSTSSARWSLTNTGDATLTTLGATAVTTSDTLTFAGTAGTVTWSSNYSNATNYTFSITGYTIATANVSARLLNGAISLADNVNLAFTNTTDGGAVGVSTTGITGGSGSGITLVGATGGMIFDVLGSASIAASAPISITAIAGTTSVAIRGTSSGAVNAGISNNSTVPTTLTAGSSTSNLNLVLNGKVTGSQGVTFNAGQGTASSNTAGGQVQLGFANDYTGETRFNGTADSLKSSSKGSVKLLLNDGISTASSGVVMGYSNGRGENLDLNGFNQSLASLTSNSGGTGVIMNTAAGTDSLLTINGAATAGSFGLQIVDGASKKVALTRSGVGTTTLTNSNSFTGGTIVSGGSLVLGHATDTLANTGAVTVSGGILDLGVNSDSVGAVIITSGSITGTSGTLTGASYTASGTSGVSTISAKLGGASSALAVTGSGGILLLSGANSYDGTTSVSSGATLRLGNASSLGSATAGTTVSSGGVLDLNGQTIGGEALTLSGTGISSGGAIVNSGAAASFGGGITLNTNSSVGLSSGDITLGGNIGESGSRNLTLVGSGRLILSGINNYTGTTTLGLTTKLQVNSPTALASGSTLVTSNTGAGNTSELNLATANTGYALGSLTLGSIFNLTAPLAGSATLTLTNGGAQIGTSGKTLNPGTNTTLVVGSTVGGSNFDLIGSTATADRSLTLTGAGDVTFNSILRDNASGSAAIYKGGIAKSGSGTVTLNTTNTYTGPTTVSAGKLVIDGSVSTSSLITVSGTGILGGSGTVGAASILSGGTLAVGKSPGTLSFTDLSLASGSTYLYELTGGGTAADLGDISGTLSIDTAAILDAVQLGTYTLGDKFTLFAYDGLLAGNFSGLIDGATFTGAGGMWEINYDDSIAGANGGSGTNYVTITAVPEPTFAMLLGGLGGLTLLHRRRA